MRIIQHTHLQAQFILIIVPLFLLLTTVLLHMELGSVRIYLIILLFIQANMRLLIGIIIATILQSSTIADFQAAHKYSETTLELIVPMGCLG